MRASMIFCRFCFIVCITAFMLLSGCMTAHKINPGKIDTSETYRIGVVKVAGAVPIPFGNHIEKKIQALNNIQYEEICKIIQNKYGIYIKTEILDKTPKILVEYENNNPIKNVYFGNDLFEQKSPIPIAGLFNYYKRQNVDGKNYIDITYYITGSSNPLKPSLKSYYNIVVRKNNEDIIIHKDKVSEAKVPMLAIFNLVEELDVLWNSIISSARDIDEALLRDIE